MSASADVQLSFVPSRFVVNYIDGKPNSIEFIGPIGSRDYKSHYIFDNLNGKPVKFVDSSGTYWTFFGNKLSGETASDQSYGVSIVCTAPRRD